MRRSVFLALSFAFLLSLSLQGDETGSFPAPQKELITSFKKVFFRAFPQAHNPSLIDTEWGILMTFRWVPDSAAPWISQIGIVLLDDNFNPKSEPQFLNTRLMGSHIPSQSEDARVCSCDGRLYVVYNDNPKLVNPTADQRRDMYVAELIYANGFFELSEPLKVVHKNKYHQVKWQKNWVPFAWENKLLLSYSIIPHEVLLPDMESGLCSPLVAAPFKNTGWKWGWGSVRGGTPALLFDGEYLAFFHSSIVTDSSFSQGEAMHHYFMGAYTFSADPPFTVTKITERPLVAKLFYEPSSYDKRVVFPGGFIERDDCFYLAYGKDDQEMWIATIDKKKLKQLLTPIESLPKIAQ